MSIRILEVGPRDGLQNEKVILTTEKKYELVKKLIGAGLEHIETGAFVNPKAVPQMADSEQLLKMLIKDFPKTSFYSLVPNMKGFETAMNTGVKNIGLLTSCCEVFNQKNLNTSTKGSLLRIKEILEECPKEIFCRLYLSMSFHSPFSGFISNESYNNILEQLSDLNIDEIVISDTTGKATPDLVNNRIFLTQKFFGTNRIACHFHDTFSNALANIQEALKHRITNFDSSIGGLGGCPYSPGASGNVSTEALIELLHSLEHDTQVNLDKIKQISLEVKATFSE
ncbi:MAG: hydroxymethylglutaryl-CoA lyase [Lentisphaeraceae bacterium]|nr:hydroxymethylglutaryl-CoA lyase [Lentisphaeraceae bacterium]